MLEQLGSMDLEPENGPLVLLQLLFMEIESRDAGAHANGRSATIRSIVGLAIRNSGGIVTLPGYPLPSRMAFRPGHSRGALPSRSNELGDKVPEIAIRHESPGSSVLARAFDNGARTIGNAFIIKSNVQPNWLSQR